MDTTKIILTVISTILVPIVSFLIKLAVDNRNLKKRDAQLKELCNYAFGTIDMIIQDEIKVTPEVRGAMKKVSKRYHKLDLVKESIKEHKETNNSEE